MDPAREIRHVSRLLGLIPPAAADKLDPGMRTVRYVSIRKEADKTKSYNTKQESMDEGKGTRIAQHSISRSPESVTAI